MFRFHTKRSKRDGVQKQHFKGEDVVFRTQDQIGIIINTLMRVLDRGLHDSEW